MAEKTTYPKDYDHIALENKWRQEWDRLGVFKWDPTAPREKTYVVDTPPPTVSGSLHVGHAYSYSQTDVLVRYHRMTGKNIFYPMGWDDNGLPTERRAQNVFNIRCEPHLPYDPEWKPKRDDNKDPKKPKEQIPISRQNFIEACEIITSEDEKAFENVWRKLGLSVDWSLIYTTIGDHCRRISQLSFLDLVDKGLVYNAESVTMWDVDFRTAVSQAEIEDREKEGAFHDLLFAVEGGGEFLISTTRPELLPACIAVAAHPDDLRYKHLFGARAITPLFKAPVPIVPSEHADPEKGSGILMICTFGDLADVEWWKKSGLPSRQVLGMDGKFLKISFGDGVFESLSPANAQAAYDQIAGLPVKAARKKIVEMLCQDGTAPNGHDPAMKGDPKPLIHAVRFYEKGNQPLEIITTRQWFIKILEFKEQLLKQGEKINWHPHYMRSRFDHWVAGLNQEWCISRQRYFGVPLPVWYTLTPSGQTDYSRPIFPTPGMTPIDPSIDVPPGFNAEQRDVPGGFTGEGDVMDTWATSALTPQISSHWNIDPDRHQRLFPADLRPQAHDIIRTWAFYTIAKAWHHHQEVPWRNAAISGFILDPDRKKMSKSKGNVTTPEDLLNEHSSDVFRYWAARGRLGSDSTFDNTLFKIGRKLVIKLFNASKFVLTQLDDADPNMNFSLSHVATECDRSWIYMLGKTAAAAAEAFENYDYTSALQQTEETFWTFCDHYMEMVKAKAYLYGATPDSISALTTLNWSLKTFLRLFAPFMPFITEEIWSWRYNAESISVHKAPWPSLTEIACTPKPENETSFSCAVEIISKVRGYKTTHQVSQKRPIAHLEIFGAAVDIDAARLLLAQIVDAGAVENEPIFNHDKSGIPEGERFRIQLELGDYKE